MINFFICNNHAARNVFKLKVIVVLVTPAALWAVGGLSANCYKLLL